jgi:hypothetical protein
MPHSRQDDTRIAAGAIGKLLLNGTKKLIDHTLAADIRQGLTPGMQISTLSKGDHLFSYRPKFFGFFFGGDNALMFEERRYHVPEHGLSMGTGPPKLPACVIVSHICFPQLISRFFTRKEFIYFTRTLLI